MDVCLAFSKECIQHSCFALILLVVHKMLLLELPWYLSQPNIAGPNLKHLPQIVILKHVALCSVLVAHWDEDPVDTGVSGLLADILLQHLSHTAPDDSSQPFSTSLSRSKSTLSSFLPHSGKVSYSFLKFIASQCQALWAEHEHRAHNVLAFSDHPSCFGSAFPSPLHVEELFPELDRLIPGLL